MTLVNNKALSALLVLAVGVVGGFVATDLLYLGAVVALGAAVAWAVFSYRAPVVAVTILLVVVTTSSHVLSFAYVGLGVPAGVVKLMIGSKDLLGLVILGALLVRVRPRGVSRSTVVSALLVVAYLVMIVLVNGFGGAPLQAQAVSLRGALVPVVALTIGALLSVSERRRVAVNAVYIAAIGAAYAVVELELPRTVVRDVIGVGPFWREVKQLPLFLDSATGLPGNFFTATGAPRLSGAFGDPLSAGMVLGAALVLCVAYRARIRYFPVVTAVIAGALLLTFTRNGWIIAAVGVAAVLVARLGLRQFLVASVAPAIGALVVLILSPAVGAYFTRIFSGQDGSTNAHLLALAESFTHDITFFGTGWGTGGSIAANSVDNAITSESTYIALLAQAGWLGAILLAASLIGLVVATLRGRPARTRRVVVVFALALAGTGLVSENLLTYNAGWFPILAIAMLSAAEFTPRTPSSPSARTIAERTRRIPRDQPIASGTAAPSTTAPLPVS